MCVCTLCWDSSVRLILCLVSFCVSWILSLSFCELVHEFERRLICDVGLSSGVQVLEETKSDLGQSFFFFFLSLCNVLFRD